MDQRIKIAREVAMSYIGTFYKWGGDDPDGFDCSGFVIEILKSVGILPRKYDNTADGLFSEFPISNIGMILDEPENDIGKLVYWSSTSSNKKVHIEFSLGSGLSIGASGGGSRTLTHADAMRDNAYIKIRSINSRIGMSGINDPFHAWR